MRNMKTNGLTIYSVEWSHVTILEIFILIFFNLVLDQKFYIN